MLDMESFINNLEDSIIAGKKFTEKTLVSATEVATGIVGGGIAIALVTAPIPTIIGLYVLWTINDNIESSLRKIDDKYESKTRKRILGNLKKFGVLPKKSVLTTSHLRMDIDTEDGTIDGIFTDHKIYKNKNLSDLSISSLEEIIESGAVDKETRDILEEYTKNRKLVKELH